MNGKTTQQRLDDICARSGMSESIVRRVLSAERDSIVESLKQGERATLIGRCVIRPELRQRLNNMGGTTAYIKASADVAPAIQNELGALTEFDRDNESDSEALPDGIKIQQISSLL